MTHDSEREPRVGAPAADVPDEAARASSGTSPVDASNGTGTPNDPGSDDAPAAPPQGAANAAAAYAEVADAAEAGPDGADGASVETESEDSGHQVVQDLEELTAKAEKAEEYLSLAQRTKADFENFRKRAGRDAALAQERGVAKLAKELLPAIDNLDRAVQAVAAFAAGSPEEAAAEAESQLASGIKLVHADVLAALARVGIEPFSPSGEPFDPQLHEAVAQHPVEGTASGTVVEVYQQGYRLGETVLRPARVLVAA
jgi:molecular chaperone GrpE